MDKEIYQHKYMLMEVFKRHNDQMAELVGHEYSPATLEWFKTAYRYNKKGAFAPVVNN